MLKEVLIVGNCNFDGPRLKKLVEENFKASARDIKKFDEAREILNSGPEPDLVIVNRAGAFDKGDGIEFIKELKDKGFEKPMMLITNFEDKMDESLKVGGVRGFGKKLIIGKDVSEESKKEAVKILSEYL